LVNLGWARCAGRAGEDSVHRWLHFGPPAVRYETHPFPEGDESIGRDLLKSFVQATWPIHVDVRHRGVPQTEMQAGIAAREKAGLTQDRLRLGLATIMDNHPGSNGASIGLYAVQFHFDPVGLTLEVIAQKRGRLVEIDDQYVDIPVVVEVSKSASPTTVCRCYTRTRLPDEFFENAFAQVPKDDAWCLIGVLRQRSFHLRVNMACNHEEIWKTVIVEVHDASSPAYVSCFNPETRGPRGILKVPLPVVAIKDVGVVRKMRLEQIEVSVQVIIADANPHARLLHAIVAQGRTAQHAFFAKSSVTIVHEQKTWSGVASDIDVLPSVFVKIR